MRALLAFALFSLLACFVFAGSAGMHIPAVAVNGGGEMVWLSMEIRNGTGLVYTATKPLVGTDTQHSERTAVAVAMKLLGEDPGAYDALISMDAGETKEVDGPSAGAAMALLSIAALNGSSVRSDMTITGTIREDGGIASVGGLVEKITVASEMGLSYVLIPVETRASDKIIVLGLEERYGIRVVEVGDIGSAAAIAFSPEGSAVPVSAPLQLPVATGISEYAYACGNCGTGRFGEIARETVERNSAVVDALARKNLSAHSDILPLLEKNSADSRTALAKGYYYTAANTAFLNEVDAEMMENVAISRAGVQQALSDAEDCVSSLARPELTVENMHFVFGGDLRAVWADDKIAETRKKIAMTSDGDYTGVLSTYKEALYAGGWCAVAAGLYSEALEIGGAPADENVTGGYAMRAVREAEDAYLFSGMSDEDTAWHLSMAMKSLNASRYGAAVLDAGYVMGAVRSANETLETVNATATGFVSRKGKTLWPALFFAHASYYAQAEPGAIGSILRLGFIADELERTSLAMETMLADPETAPDFSRTPAQAGACGDDEINSSLVILVVLLCALLVASAILNIVMMTLIRGRKGDGGNALVKRNTRVKRK